MDNTAATTNKTANAVKFVSTAVTAVVDKSCARTAAQTLFEHVEADPDQLEHIMVGSYVSLLVKETLASNEPHHGYRNYLTHSMFCNDATIVVQGLRHCQSR